MVNKLFLLVSLFLFCSCSESKIIRITGTEEASNLIINKVEQVVVDIYYEPTTVPYVGQISSEIGTWEVLEENLKKIYEGKKAENNIFVPQTLAEMTEIPDQGKSTWTTEELYALSQSVLQNSQSVEQAVFVILFVKGFLEDGGVVKAGTIGVSIGNSRVIAVFKDAIDLSGETEIVKKFMEQSTLVHETGHAVGLVNRGIRLTTEHQDEEHGAHCTNPDCVMFWLNEGSAEIATFVSNFIATNSAVIFGEECLNDIKGFNP